MIMMIPILEQTRMGSIVANVKACSRLLTCKLVNIRFDLREYGRSSLGVGVFGLNPGPYIIVIIYSYILVSKPVKIPLGNEGCDQNS